MAEVSSLDAIRRTNEGIGLYKGLILASIASAVGVTGSAVLLENSPKSVETRDITGDGVADVVVESGGYFGRNVKTFFIGDRAGNYTKVELKKTPDGIEYLVAPDGFKYVWNGKHYRLLIQE